MAARLYSLVGTLSSYQSKLAPQADLAVTGVGSVPLCLQPLGWAPPIDDRLSIQL